jgi:thioester reductase-like protein
MNSFWEPTHVTVGVFEVQNTTCASMANQVKIIFDSNGLLDKVIAYVKIKGSNLNTLTNVLKKLFVLAFNYLPHLYKIMF